MRPDVWRVEDRGADPLNGKVVMSASKLLWNGGMVLSAAALAPVFFSWSALIVFVLSTYVTLLLGHSVGMHRCLIHRSFDCPKWLERSLVYLGVLVGMAGPHGILRIHDLRDWAQRAPSCHDFFAHRVPLAKDALWQLTCVFRFDNPPRFVIEKDISEDPFYTWLERTWMLHQIPVAALLFLGGGMAWVVWGVLVRVSVSVIGHWTVTYLTHNPGPARWCVPGAGVQASDLPGYGLITMGECWHSNHHAFPESARIGLYSGQTDPSWWVIQGLWRMGLVSRIGIPRSATQCRDIAPCLDD